MTLDNYTLVMKDLESQLRASNAEIISLTSSLNMQRQLNKQTLLDSEERIRRIEHEQFTRRSDADAANQTEIA